MWSIDWLTKVHLTIIYATHVSYLHDTEREDDGDAIFSCCAGRIVGRDAVWVVFFLTVTPSFTSRPLSGVNKRRTVDVVTPSARGKGRGKTLPRGRRWDPIFCWTGRLTEAQGWQNNAHSVLIKYKYRLCKAMHWIWYKKMWWFIAFI